MACRARASSSGDAAVGDLGAHPARRGGGRTGGVLELGQGTVDGVAVAQAGHLAQRAQPHHEGHRLVDAEAQRAGDRVGVADEDPALLPVGLDELVGHLAVAAEEEQVEVGLELLDADAEVVGGLPAGRCPAG